MEFLTISSTSSLSPFQNRPKTNKSISKNRFSTHHNTTISHPAIFHHNVLHFSQTNRLFGKPFKTRKTGSCIFFGFERWELLKLKEHNSITKSAYFLKIPSTQVADLLQNHLPIVKSDSFLRISSTHLLTTLQNRVSIFKTASSVIISATHLSIPLKFRISIDKDTSFLKIIATHLSIPLKFHISIEKDACFLKKLGTHLQHPFQNHPSIFKIASFLFLMAETVPFPSFAAETSVPTEQVSDKINIESILISIDDFFNRYPFFVATVTFIWLAVIPLIQDYLKKYKYISAIDGFRKLNNDPNAQLLDIRDKQSLSYIRSPNLRILNKGVVQVEFVEGKEESFAKEVLANFSDPGNTVICILDNFDGNSLKVAELLFTNGFKEAYAIKGGLRGKDGWQEIQENLLPPSVHVSPRKKGKRKTSQKLDMNAQKISEKSGNSMAASKEVLPDEDKTSENGYVKPTSSLQANLGHEQSLSPYPNYPDMKPPSSPTPSKPN